MKRLTKSIWLGLSGIRSCFGRETNFKIHTAFTVLVIAAGFFFKINSFEWLIIFICIASVLSTELMNTAMEVLCNIVHKEHHPGIKLVKDMAAGAVLVTALAAAACGAFIFIPKIILCLNQ